MLSVDPLRANRLGFNKCVCVRLPVITFQPQLHIIQRKKTLLKEYQDKDRVGGILDRRFGENDPTITPEDRMLERFTKERQRESKGVLFNLEDEDELTHYGRSLSMLDDFDNVSLRLDDEDDEDGGQINSRTVHKVHFGGFESEEDADDEKVSGVFPH